MSDKQNATKDLIRARFEDVQSEIKAFEIEIAPARKQLDDAAAVYEKARLVWGTAKKDLVPKLQKDRARALAEENATLAMALGGKRLSGGTGA